MNGNQNGECSQQKYSTNYNYFRSFLVQNHWEEFSTNHFQQCEKLTDHLIYFNGLFSVKSTAQSIQKKNQNLYQINFEQSDSEHDDIYLRRKTKVNKLQKKEQIQLQELENLKESNFPKYQAIAKYLKFLYDTKQKINGARTDYYSTKTFCALINSSEEEISVLTTVLKQMLGRILKFPQKPLNQGQFSSSQNDIDIRILEFLIIPRFLISKQKIMRLIRDESLQKNFQFLIQNLCLGHYNNQANKKMPQNDRVQYVRQLLKKSSRGREKFKKICSINHGNKFLKNYSQQYFELYSKSYDYLYFLQNELRRGKKFTQLKEELKKIQTRQTEETENSQCQSLSSNSNRISFRSLKQEFNQMNLSDGTSEDILSISSLSMSKLSDKGIQIQQEEEKKPNVVFKVRKSLTTNSRKTANIILVEPPNQA